MESLVWSWHPRALERTGRALSWFYLHKHIPWYRMWSTKSLTLSSCFISQVSPTWVLRPKPDIENIFKGWCLGCWSHFVSNDIRQKTIRAWILSRAYLARKDNLWKNACWASIQTPNFTGGEGLKARHMQKMHTFSSIKILNTSILSSTIFVPLRQQDFLLRCLKPNQLQRPDVLQAANDPYIAMIGTCLKPNKSNKTSNWPVRASPRSPLFFLILQREL